MPNEEFKRGEAKAHLENIQGDVIEIKAEVRTLHSKIDDVDEAAQLAAGKAKEAAVKVDHQEGVNNDRHEQNVKALERIETKVDKLTTDQFDIKLRMYGLAALFGGGSGAVVPWLTNLL